MTHTTKTTASLALGKIAALVALTAGLALVATPSHAAQASTSASASTRGAKAAHTRLAVTTSPTTSPVDAQGSSGERRGGLQRVDYSRAQIIARLDYINAKMAEMEPVARHASSRARYYSTTDSWSQYSYWSAYAISLWRNLSQLSLERIQLQRMLQ